MDRLIWLAWRAFWVGLGASSVIVAQSLASAAPPTPAPAATDAPVHEVPAAEKPYAASVPRPWKRNAS